MAVLSALFGLGVGAFRSFSRPERTAMHQVKDALRTVRLVAQAEGAVAELSVLPARGQIITSALRTVGNWHFETLAGSGWPVDARHEGARLVSGAEATAVPRLGQALELREGAILRLEDLPPSFDSPYGFGLDVFLQPASDGRPMTVLERPGSWVVELSSERVLRVRLMLESDAVPQQADRPAPVAGAERVAQEPAPTGREWLADIPEVVLPSDRMARLSVRFDGRALSVSLNGARRQLDGAFGRPRRLVTVPGVPISTGAAGRQFRGVMDELRLASVRRGAARDLPVDVALEGEDFQVHVDAFGHLDPAWHGAPARIAFTFGEPQRRTVVEMGLLGGVRSWDEAVVAPGSEEGEQSVTNGDPP